MGYVHLLRPWNHIGHQHSHFCSILIFVSYLLLITSIVKNPALQRYKVIERNIVESNVETVKYFQLVVFTVSNR